MTAASRHRFSRLAIVSAVLCVTALVVWVLSYTRPLSAEFSFAKQAPHGGFDDSTEWGLHIKSINGSLHLWRFYSTSHWYAEYWKLVIIFLALPARRWIPWERIPVHQYRQENGLCVHCGYDLRGTPDRCPECGTLRVKEPA